VLYEGDVCILAARRDVAAGGELTCDYKISIADGTRSRATGDGLRSSGVGSGRPDKRTKGAGAGPRTFDLFSPPLSPGAAELPPGETAD
jgi:hypothetical protein